MGSGVGGGVGASGAGTVLGGSVVAAVVECSVETVWASAVGRLEPRERRVAQITNQTIAPMTASIHRMRPTDTPQGPNAEPAQKRACPIPQSPPPQKNAQWQ